MAESPTDSSSESRSASTLPSSQKAENFVVPQIPIEIVSDEEMALMEAALAATRFTSFATPATCSLACSSLFSSQLQKNVRSIQAITLLSKRGFSDRTQPEIEDSGVLRCTQKKSRVVESFLKLFRRQRGLSVTDITGTEWCEKQMEFVLRFGKLKKNRAMKVGSARHVKLEEEVLKKVKVNVKSIEDIWALKFMNFINGANQLLLEGLTRELPVIGFVDNVWMVGVIDELRMPVSKTERMLILVDTKTRVRDTIPAEPQRRNGRLQLMCYKYLWDNSVSDNFPSNKFFYFFSLNPYQILSEDIREKTAGAGFPATTLDDMVRYYRNSCSMLPPAHNQLLLRYEYQKDDSLLCEDEFQYDHEWVKTKIQGCLEFWTGEREATYTPEEERWKCRYCQFADVCPANSNPHDPSEPVRTDLNTSQT